MNCTTWEGQLLRSRLCCPLTFEGGKHSFEANNVKHLGQRRKTVWKRSRGNPSTPKTNIAESLQLNSSLNQLCVCCSIHTPFIMWATRSVCVCPCTFACNWESTELTNEQFVAGSDSVQFVHPRVFCFFLFFWMQPYPTTQHYFVLNTWTNSWCYNFLVTPYLHYSVPRVQKPSQIQH